MATKKTARVSWCVVIGAEYCYYDTRKEALHRTSLAIQQGYPVMEMVRWSICGDDVTKNPVDFETLLAKRASKPVVKTLGTPIKMPAAVWAEVQRALSI